ncbi:MAG TPA: hypothetical protein DDW70_07280, partial [Rikenellaceae bacterium]|nr:hypothetical protein [Rikenellaceae bacterium]
MKKLLYLQIVMSSILSACGGPQGFITEQTPPPIYPDYPGVTIPVNIAPLNFMISDANRLR